MIAGGLINKLTMTCGEECGDKASGITIKSIQDNTNGKVCIGNEQFGMASCHQHNPY